mgnify:CR=1 FL=1|tara:strand:+ start:252 stop:458 length:207 start_codon:yes stop_codon:yes gene_type:complete
MAFYIKTDDGVTGGGGDYYVGEGLPGHWGIKAEGTTYSSSSNAQAVINANKDSSGKLFGRSNPQPVEE